MPPTTNGATQNGGDHTTAGAPTEDDAKNLWNRYEYARFGDNMKNELIEDIITRYESLVKTHTQYVAAHQQEREAAQSAVLRVEGMQGSIDYLQRLLNRDPFILVLIDGNGMIFHHNFLKQGELGGKTAANTVNNAIFEWARNNITEVPEDTKVVVRVYANVKGIAEACAKTGIVDHPSRVEEFVRGFTSANPLSDFVDVGASNDAVEGKINESLKLYLYNYYCRHILFGGSHNDQYANMLQPYMHDTQAKGRITLLEAIPFGPELAALPLRQKKIPGVFRDTKTTLPGPLNVYTDSRTRVSSNTSLNAASGVFTPRTQTPALSSPFGSVTSFDHNAMTGRPYHRADSSMDDSENGGGTWAKVTSRHAHRPVRELVVSPPRVSAPTIQRNKKGYRLDSTMQYDREEVQRLKKLKACNQHYIGFGCCHYNAGKADKCPHSHHYQFTAAELKTLRVVARETPCKRSHECDDPKCIYGHQCPFPAASEGSMRGSGLCLNGEGCRFPASMHGMDLQPMRITKVTGIY